MEKFKELTLLNDGKLFPMVGVGTFQITSRDSIFQVVKEALELGLRAFDTAAVYRNETLLAEAFETYLPKFGLTREDIYITSKLNPAYHGGGDTTKAAVLKSIENLKCEYLDMYLIHWPGVSGLRSEDRSNAELRAQTWAALVQLKNDGRLRSIGVSNYTKKHLTELLDYSGGVLPTVNQIEFHPHYQPWEDIKICRNLNILVQAYSSFGGSGNKNLLQENVIIEISKRINKAPSSILLKWALQQDIAVIPKTVTLKYMKQNIDLDFDLAEKDMKLISALSKNVKYAWNPITVE